MFDGRGPQTLFVIAGILSGLLALATILPFVPSGEWYVRLFDFPRLQILVLLLLPLMLIGAAMLLAHRFSMASVVILIPVLTTAVVQLLFILPFTSVWKQELSSSTKEENQLRLLVANIEYENHNFDPVISAIAMQDADLLLLVEVDDAWRAELKEIETRYPHRIDVVRGEGLGLALWSRLPIIEHDVEYLVSERRPSIFATIESEDGRQFKFVGIHPTPPGLKDSTGDERRNSRVRDAELMIVAERIREDSTLPWVVAGDFNDVAWSHTTRLFQRRSGLCDPRIGRGLYNTYHANYPVFRYPIDQVFLSPDSEIAHLGRVHLPGSDHFGMLTDFHLGGEPDPEPQGNDEKDAEEMKEEGKKDAKKRDIESDEAKSN